VRACIEETMSELTVANYLATLQDDPWDQKALEGLKEALQSSDSARLGKEPVRLLEFARRNHEVRGESFAAARLMELEISLVEGDPDFAAVLYRELGRIRRDELMDDAGAQEAFEHALVLRPGDEEVQRTLEQIQQIGPRHQELATHFMEQAAAATDQSLKTSLLVRAASVLWQHKKKGKNKEVDRLFREALATDPSSVRAARLYEITLRDRGKWKDLGEILLTAADHVTGRDDRLGLLLSTARVHAQRLNDASVAATCYERVLELVPAHEEAMSFLVAHFTEAKAWEHLVALYEDTLKARLLKPESEQGILIQIAMLHWKMLGRAERAEAYFARARKSDPAQPLMLDFYRELYGSTGDTGKLVTVLTDAQRRVTSDVDKAALALEIARLAQDDQHSSERAIDAFKLVLRHDPTHGEALDALKQLYRRSGKWNALVELLRNELDALGEGDKTRRLALLWELLAIYRDELKLESTVLATYNAILQLDPASKEAVEQLARLYESLGRYHDLIPVLMREVDAETDPARKVGTLLRIARLWVEHFSNFNQATTPLEQVLELEPNNREALSRLKEIYGKKRAFKQLFGVLSREEELTNDVAQKGPLLVELAALAGERLHDYPAAIALWKRAASLEPDSLKILDALEKLGERAKDWDTVADAVERRVALSGDAATKIRMLTRLGTLHAERTMDAARAASVWQRVLALDPKNGRALRTLRESYLASGDFDSVEVLYAEANDYEGFVDVLGAAADKAAQPDKKKELSFRAAQVYEKQLNEPARAFRSYERVLSVEPDNERAVRALLPIYEKDDKWPKVAALLEVLLAKAKGGANELELLLRLVEVTLTKLREGERAFGFALRAFACDPRDERVRPRLEAAAELASAIDRLVGAYATRADEAPADEAVVLRKRAAQLAMERLKRVDDAAALLEKLFADHPDDSDAYALLERIYRGDQKPEKLRALMERRLVTVVSADDQAKLMLELAKLAEGPLCDRPLALGYTQRLHALRPDDRDVLASLDRLLAAEARNAELAGVLEKRVALTDDSRGRVELLLRLGGLLLDTLDKSGEATDVFIKVLALDPLEARAVEALERIASSEPARAPGIGRVLEAYYERIHKRDKLVVLLRARLNEPLSPDERRALKLRLSELSASLGDPRGAYTTLESAFLDNPQNESLWDSLTHVAGQAGCYEELATAFTTAIEAGSLEDDVAGALSARAASVYDDLLGQPEKAERYHVRVLALDPHADDAYGALRELYTNKERWDDLKRLYRVRIEHTPDLQQRLELLLQVCFLHEEILDDVSLAIESYREVLALDPSHVTSRRALERLYTRAERHRDLVDLLAGDLDSAEGKEATDLWYRIGELQERKLRQADKAVDAYAAVIDEQPTHLRAQEALSRLIVDTSQRQRIAALLGPVYAAQGAHAELAQVLEVSLEALEVPEERLPVLMRLGETYERDLHDLDRAFKAFARAVVSDPGEELARIELARVASTTGQHEEHAKLLESVLQGALAPEVRTAILGELAELWDVLSFDRERAVDAYERLIASAEGEGEVVLRGARALERLHGMVDDYPKLAANIALQVRHEGDADTKASLLGRLAELQERELKDIPQAIKAYVERLELLPQDLVAMEALERLYAERGEHSLLIGILERRDAIARSEDEGRAVGRQIGRIYEEKLNDREHAILAYRSVLDRFGDDRETLSMLQRTFAHAERNQDLLDATLAELALVQDPMARAEVRFRAAELMRLRTGAAESSLDAYRQVLEDHPGHAGAIEALHAVADGAGALRVQAARVLVPHYEATQEYEPLIRALRVVANTDDVREQLTSLRRAAEVAEVGLGDATRAYELMAQGVPAALGENDLALWLEELDRLAHAAQAFEPYAKLLQSVADGIEDEETSVNVLMRLASVARDRLQDKALARSCFDRVLTQRPDHERALDALEQLHVESGDDRSLLAVLRTKAELAPDAYGRTRLLMRQAELCAGKLDDVTAAIEAYERVLSEAPSLEVFTGLEGLYARASRHSDLVLMYERQLDLNMGDTVDLRFRLAELLRTHLNDAERAIELYKAICERNALHEPTQRALEAMMRDGPYRARAAELLEPMYVRKAQWPDLARALEAQFVEEHLVENKKELLNRLAQLHEVQLEDFDAALETYARLFEVDPDDTHVWDALARLSRLLKKQPRVAEVYERFLDGATEENDTFVRLSVMAAQIREQFSADLVRSSKLYQRALGALPASRPVADALESVLVRRGASLELKTFYAQQAEIAEEEGRRIDCLHKLARVYEEDLKDDAAAIATHERALETRNADTHAIQALDRLLGEAQRWSKLGEHLRYQIDLADVPRETVPLKQRLARLYEERLDDVRLAIDTYEEIVGIDPANAEARHALERLCGRPELLPRVAEILEPLYEGAGEWSKQIWLAEQLVSVESDSAERSRIYGTIARLYEFRGKALPQAMAAYRRALVTDPRDDHARAELMRLAERLGDWDALVGALDEAVDATVDNEVKASLLLDIARAHDEHRGDPRAAIVAYDRLVQIDTDDRGAVDQLESLLTMVGDWTGVVNLYKRKVERSYDPLERAELWRRAGAVLDELLSDTDGAVAAYNSALEEVADDLASLAALDELYGRADAHQAHSEVLRQRGELSSDPAERIDVHLRLGGVLAKNLGRSQEAIEAYQRVLEDDPDCDAAIAALGALYEADGMWHELLGNLRTQLARATAPDVRLGMLTRLGHVHDERLSEFDDAIECYREALEIDRANDGAIRALMRLGEPSEYRERVEAILEPVLRESSRTDELATLLGRGLSGLSDPYERQARLVALADVQEHGRQDLTLAFDAIADALMQDADVGELPERLERLGRAIGRFDAVTRALAHRAAATSDAELSRDLFRRVARIAEQDLHDLDRTIEANEQAVERAGDDEAILADLDRLYATTQRFDDLADVLERRVAIADGESAAALLFRLGELRSSRFGDLRGALGAYREVVERVPTHEGATHALERMISEPDLLPDVVDVLDHVYRDTHQLNKVVDLYEVRIKAADSVAHRVELLTSLARLWEDELGDAAKAAESLRRAFEADATDHGLLDDIERVAAAGQRFDVLAGLVESAVRIPGVARIDARDLWMRAAGWYQDLIGDPARAEHALRSALLVDPEHEPAHEALVVLLRKTARHTDLVDALSAWAEREPDRNVAVDRMLEAARVAEREANNPDRALDCFERVLSIDTASREALDELIRIYEAQGKLGKVVHLYERRIDVEDDPRVRNVMRGRAAAIRASQLDDREGAIRLYEACLDDEPEHPTALAELTRLFEASGAYDDLARILAIRLDVAISKEERASLRVALAGVAERHLGNVDRAIDELREVVIENPLHVEAHRALERLLSEHGRYEELATELERRADQAAALGDARAELGALSNLGVLLREKLGDDERARDVFERILARDPHEPTALRALARFAAAEGDIARSAALEEQLLPRLRGEELVALAYSLASTLEEKLDARDRADQVLRVALRSNVRHAETRERLFALCERHNDFAALSALIAEEVEVTADVAQKVELLRRASDIARTRLGDAAAASHFLERASQLVPDDRSVLVPLCELYLEAGRQADAIPVLQRIVASFGGRRVKELAGFHHLLARAYRGLNDPVRALAELDAAYRIDLTNLAVLRDLGILAYEQGDYERAQKTFRGILLQRLDRNAPISKGDVYYYLGEISHKQGDVQKAISMLERAVAEQAGHERARALLSSLKA